MIKAALALANVTGKPDYIERAKAWAEVLDQHYWSENLGGYYFTADDTSDLIVRPFSGQDEATPNANGTMVSNLVALYLWTGEERYRQRADAILRGFAGAMAANVLAHAGLLAASLDAMAPAHIVLIAPEGKSTRELRARAQGCVAAECGGAGGEGRGVGRQRPAGVIAGARQDRDRRQAHRLSSASARNAGRERPAGIIAGAWQDRARRQAHGFRLHRPAMLIAGDGACGAGGDGEGRAAGCEQSFSCSDRKGIESMTQPRRDSARMLPTCAASARQKFRQDGSVRRSQSAPAKGKAPCSASRSSRIEFLLERGGAHATAASSPSPGIARPSAVALRSSLPTSRRTNTMRKFSGNLPIARSSTLATCVRMVSASGEAGRSDPSIKSLPIVVDIGNGPLVQQPVSAARPCDAVPTPR